MSTYYGLTEFYNDLVLATAIRLIKEKGSTTTLDIKNELRTRHATIDFGNIDVRPIITQDIVSDSMEFLADNSYFSYTDNGTYRTYYLNTVEFNDNDDIKTTNTNVSLADALEIINDLKKDDNITITFIKKDGNIRTINGTVYSPNTLGLGSILVYDNEEPDGKNGSNIRTVDLRKLVSFEFDNFLYTVVKQ